MMSALPDADVVYQTRVQRERHGEAAKGAAQQGQDMRFVLDVKALAAMKKKSIIMHPLPRVNEIDTAVDADPRAAYFRQAENGLFVRMALLDALIDGRQ
jgi:aspartate carbamoyltransferase catalytic subunit